MLEENNLLQITQNFLILPKTDKMKFNFLLCEACIYAGIVKTTYEVLTITCIVLEHKLLIRHNSNIKLDFRTSCFVAEY